MPDTLKKGTVVWMSIDNNIDKKLIDIFGELVSAEDGFTKTVIPLTLAKMEGDNLITRSQARRILTRCELFKVILLDFNGVELIGQGFADEVFRVFARNHPEIEITPINMNDDVKKMIKHVSNRITG